jgi:hypothetical protein
MYFLGGAFNEHMCGNCADSTEKASPQFVYRVEYWCVPAVELIAMLLHSAPHVVFVLEVMLVILSAAIGALSDFLKRREEDRAAAFGCYLFVLLISIHCTSALLNSKTADPMVKPSESVLCSVILSCLQRESHRESCHFDSGFLQFLYIKFSIEFPAKCIGRHIHQK